MVTLGGLPHPRRIPARADRFRLCASSWGSVSVQARDHRERRSNQLSADSNQRDYARCLSSEASLSARVVFPHPDAGISLGELTDSAGRGRVGTSHSDWDRHLGLFASERSKQRHSGLRTEKPQ